MTLQYLRTCRLVLESSSKQLDLSELRIRFTVQQGALGNPNSLDVTVTNLSDKTANPLVSPQNEYKGVTLQAGYGSELQTIFDGQIIQVRKGQETPTETFLNIIAAEGGQAHTLAVVNKSLAAGHTFRDIVDVALEAMKPFGVSAGFIADLGSQKMPRMVSLFGLASDTLRKVCFATGTSWSIQGKKLQITKNTKALAGKAVVLNSGTGLIGSPTITLDGLEARCLLNPKLRPGTLVQVAERDVQQGVYTTDPAAQDFNFGLQSNLAADGFYQAWVVEHEGDTRGGPWYSNLVCTRADGQGVAPANLGERGVINPTASTA